MYLYKYMRTTHFACYAQNVCEHSDNANLSDIWPTSSCIPAVNTIGLSFILT